MDKSPPHGIEQNPLPLPMGEVAERSEDGEGKLGCKVLSYYFLIKIFILIRKASPDGAACFVIYKERNHKTSLI